MPAKKRIRAPRRKRLDKSAQKARETAIIADLKAGKLSYRLIAEKHKVSLPTVNAKARKANIRRPRGRRPAVATPMVAMAAKPAKKERARRTVAPVAIKARGVRRRGRPRGRVAARIVRAIAPRGAFQNAFREMVLRYYPKLTLAQFDKLSKMIDKAVS
jgi:hypothetical protein